MMEKRNREPYYLETSMPGVFAAGDVRHGNALPCCNCQQARVLQWSRNSTNRWRCDAIVAKAGLAN